MTRSQYALRALGWIFAQPIFRAPDFIERAGIPAPTARRFLSVLREHHIIKDLRPGLGRCAAVLAFPALLNITA
jgi:DNA-binding IclR family transcriptional regulator